jgi:hypothetical protein
MPQCVKQEEFQKANDLLLSAVDGRFESLAKGNRAPCRSIEKVQFDFREIDIASDEASPRVVIEVYFKESTYKEVRSVRSMDLQGLIGDLNT